MRNPALTDPRPEQGGLLLVVVLSSILGALAGWVAHAWTEPVHALPPAPIEVETNE